MVLRILTEYIETCGAGAPGIYGAGPPGASGRIKHQIEENPEFWPANDLDGDVVAVSTAVLWWFKDQSDELVMAIESVMNLDDQHDDRKSTSPLVRTPK